MIESLRAFDIVCVINKGRNGLELLSALVTDNIVGEASRIGFGSALAVRSCWSSRSVFIVTTWPAAAGRRTGMSTAVDRRAQRTAPAGAAAPAPHAAAPGADPAARLPHRHWRWSGSSRSSGRSTPRCARTRTPPSTATSRFAGMLTFDNYIERLEAGASCRKYFLNTSDHHRAGRAAHAVPRLVRGVRRSSRFSWRLNMSLLLALHRRQPAAAAGRCSSRCTGSTSEMPLPDG